MAYLVLLSSIGFLFQLVSLQLTPQGNLHFFFLFFLLFFSIIFSSCYLFWLKWSCELRLLLSIVVYFLSFIYFANWFNCSMDVNGLLCMITKLSRHAQCNSV